MTLRNAILFAFLASLFSANVSASGSTLHFQGYLKEDTCQITLQNKHVNADCPRTTQPRISLIRSDDRLKALPNHQGSMKLVWIDNAKQKGIITTDYR
ncbi:hypothetical protein [Pantoea sp. S18]|uniref:hypothetical protein n=1 Tax=Pantoea sp. S18 TaxID=3019892 RepID=UPI002B206BF9|nr:hypothetical protein [Pantoea sp. S18]MEA5101244.1 hypothetical protein [Pantoea sp. S18]